MLHAIWQIIGAPIALGIDTSAVESDVQNRCQEFGKGEVNLAISKKKAGADHIGHRSIGY